MNYIMAKDKRMQIYVEASINKAEDVGDAIEDA
jgi:hypothetical protein